jgi:hypothetical protein
MPKNIAYRIIESAAEVRSHQSGAKDSEPDHISTDFYYVLLKAGTVSEKVNPG